MRTPKDGWKNRKQIKSARVKQKIHLTKMLVGLSKATDTAQIKFCDPKGAWSELKFNNITSITLRKQKQAILNKNKKGEQRSDKEDRIVCANNYKAHLDQALSGDKNAKVHGKRCNVGELVKDALDKTANSNKSIYNTVNLQWESNKANNKGLEGKPIITMCDTSGSMECDEALPLYNAMGLSLRVSELCHPAFQNRIMTFSAVPTWVCFNDDETFVDKVKILRRANWGCNTNFYCALDNILNV